MVIRRARERLQMSQDEFARALGDRLGHPVSQSQISDWERGRFEPSASVLLAAAELADLSLDELRGAGPPSLVQRMERLEEEMDRIARHTAVGDEPDLQVDGSMPQRLAALETESTRVGALLAQVIGVLDRAGLLPTEAGAAAEESGIEAEAERTRRRAAGPD